MPHILITDDDPHLRRLVRTYAELEGFDARRPETELPRSLL